MKNLSLSLILLILSFSAISQEEKGITVTVTLENVLSSNGKILSALHNQESFMKGQGLKNDDVKAEKGEMIIEFKNVMPGTYAVSVLHDENENMRMDFQANGMPKENYGLSQNPMLMGPPNFKDAQFEVTDEDVALAIRF